MWDEARNSQIVLKIALVSGEIGIRKADARTCGAAGLVPSLNGTITSWHGRLLHFST